MLELWFIYLCFRTDTARCLWAAQELWKLSLIYLGWQYTGKDPFKLTCSQPLWPKRSCGWEMRVSFVFRSDEKRRWPGACQVACLPGRTWRQLGALPRGGPSTLSLWALLMLFLGCRETCSSHSTSHWGWKLFIANSRPRNTWFPSQSEAILIPSHTAQDWLQSSPIYCNF